MEFSFWLIAALIVYTYIGYPLLIRIVASFYKEPDYPDLIDYPAISFILSAFNEEAVIEDKIRNCLEIDYPENKIEILVGSDGSTDRTNDILENINDQRVRTYLYTGRHGKSWVINNLVKDSTGDILIFSDANIIFSRNAVKKLVEPFQDELAGGVCGNLVMVSGNSDEIKTAEQSYWSLESRLKKMESRIKTTFGATGAIYAIRKSLFRELPIETPVVDDFIIPVFVMMQRYRVIYREQALAFEEITDDLFLEFKRRIRIGARNLNGIRFYSSLLWPTSGFISLGLWSHKILRWFVPFMLLAVFLLTIMLSNNPFYMKILYVEGGFLLSAALGMILSFLNIRIKLLNYLAYLVTLNLALFLGFFKFIFGTQKPYWETSNRPK